MYVAVPCYNRMYFVANVYPVSVFKALYLCIPVKGGAHIWYVNSLVCLVPTPLTKYCTCMYQSYIFGLI